MNHHPLPPIKNSTVTAGKDNIIRQDYQTQHQQINIKVGDDFSDILIPITISDTEFSVGIWMYFLPRNRPPELSGLFRDGIINMLQQHGFHKRFRDNNTYFFLQETNNQIQEVEPVNMKDFVFGQIKKFELPLKFDYRGCHVVTTQEKLRETFERQSHTIFNESFLELLPNHTKPILRDTKKSAFFFFKNTIVQVTNGEHHLIPYDQIGDVCIWKKQILNHDFEYMQRHRECHFAKFINNVSNNEPGREIAFISAIGYLLHNYIDPSKGQAVVAYDEEITDIKHPMGGTGKGLFAQAIGQMRVTTKIDGKKFDPNDRFRFQNVKDDTQVVWFDDAKPNLAFEVFHSNLTDGWMIEQKHKD